MPYVALVASRKRGTAVRDSLDVPDELRAQLHTPAGLDIGARTPTEIALSILAEIVAERRAIGMPPRELQLAVDPVCGMEVAVSAGSIQLEHEGTQLFFCSSGCRDAFAADPAGSCHGG